MRRRLGASPVVHVAEGSAAAVGRPSATRSRTAAAGRPSATRSCSRLRDGVGTAITALSGLAPAPGPTRSAWPG
eukprot:7256951-Alexandrium_andersonii.AAC.1